MDFRGIWLTPGQEVAGLARTRQRRTTACVNRPKSLGNTDQSRWRKQTPPSCDEVENSSQGWASVWSQSTEPNL